MASRSCWAAWSGPLGAPSQPSPSEVLGAALAMCPLGVTLLGVRAPSLPAAPSLGPQLHLGDTRLCRGPCSPCSQTRHTTMPSFPPSHLALWSGVPRGLQLSYIRPVSPRPSLATRLLAHKIQSPQEWEAVQALTVRCRPLWGFGARLAQKPGQPHTHPP